MRVVFSSGIPLAVLLVTAVSAQQQYDIFSQPNSNVNAMGGGFQGGAPDGGWGEPQPQPPNNNNMIVNNNMPNTAVNNNNNVGMNGGMQYAERSFDNGNNNQQPIVNNMAPAFEERGAFPANGPNNGNGMQPNGGASPQVAPGLAPATGPAPAPAPGPAPPAPAPPAPMNSPASQSFNGIKASDAASTIATVNVNNVGAMTPSPVLANAPAATTAAPAATTAAPAASETSNKAVTYSATDSSGDSKSSRLGAAGIIAGTMGAVVGIAAVAYVYKKKMSEPATPGTPPEKFFKAPPPAKQSTFYHVQAQLTPPV